MKKVEQPVKYGDSAWSTGTLVQQQQPVYWNDDCCSTPPNHTKHVKDETVGYGDSAGVWTGTLAQSRYIPSEGITLYQDGPAPAPAYTNHYDGYSGESEKYSSGIENIRTRDVATEEASNKWRKGYTPSSGPVLHL